MLNNLFQKPTAAARQADFLVHAEYALIAEALLRSSARLLGRADTQEIAQHLCDSIVDASPNIVLAWVWFGDAAAEVIEPQIMAGPARAYAESLRIERSAFTQMGPAFRALSQQRTRAFDVAPNSWFGPWREAATRHGVRSVLVVPVASGGDERGMVALYATREKYFDAIGVGLFETLGELLHAVSANVRRQGSPAESVNDAVTGLPMRRHALRKIELEWGLPSQHEQRGLLAVVDIDGFRAFNERHGQPAGDAALRHIARALKHSARRTDLVARWERDQFLLWLPGVTGATARATAEKILNDIASTPLSLDDGTEASLPVSIGAAPVSTSDNFTAAWDRADRALKRAKQQGRNCMVIARLEG